MQLFIDLRGTDGDDRLNNSRRNLSGHRGIFGDSAWNGIGAGDPAAIIIANHIPAKKTRQKAWVDHLHGSGSARVRRDVDRVWRQFDGGRYSPVEPGTPSDSFRHDQPHDPLDGTALLSLGAALEPRDAASACMEFEP